MLFHLKIFIVSVFVFAAVQFFSLSSPSRHLSGNVMIFYLIYFISTNDTRKKTTEKNQRMLSILLSTLSRSCSRESNIWMPSKSIAIFNSILILVLLCTFTGHGTHTATHTHIHKCTHTGIMYTTRQHTAAHIACVHCAYLLFVFEIQNTRLLVRLWIMTGMAVFDMRFYFSFIFFHLRFFSTTWHGIRCDAQQKLGDTIIDRSDFVSARARSSVVYGRATSVTACWVSCLVIVSILDAFGDAINYSQMSSNRIDMNLHGSPLKCITNQTINPINDRNRSIIFH